jgi:hypothetical protein
VWGVCMRSMCVRACVVRVSNFLRGKTQTGNKLTSPNGKDQALLKLNFSNSNALGNKKQKNSLTFKKGKGFRT